MTDARRWLMAMPGILRVSFAGVVAYPLQIFIGVLATSLSLVMLAFWSAVASEGPIGRFDEKQFTAYFLVAAVVRMLTATWLIYELNIEIRQGTLAKRLLRPIHPFVCYAADTFAALPLRLMIALPLFLVTVYLVDARCLARDPWLWVIATLAIGGAWLLTFAVMLTIGALCLFWNSSVAVWELWFGLTVVFSGCLLPLELLPAWLAPIVRASPFPYVLAFPVETILGMSTRTQALQELGTQWAYATAFLLGGVYLWRRGLVRFEAYGG